MYTIEKEYQFRAYCNVPTKKKIIKTGMIDYTITIKARNASVSSEGKLIEYKKLQEIRKYIGANIVHSNLNEIINNTPTLENLAKYFFDIFYEILGHFLFSVKITTNNLLSASYTPYNN